MNASIPVFRNQYVNGVDATDQGTMTSQAIPAQGNKAVLAVTVINIGGTAGTPTVTATIEGSYDGLAWEQTTATVSPTAFGYTDSEVTGLDYAYIRVQLTTNSGAAATAKAVVDVSVAFSEQ